MLVGEVSVPVGVQAAPAGQKSTMSLCSVSAGGGGVGEGGGGGPGG